ncbi:MAG: MFS transporter [Burkholderiaceae bacterium]
MLTPEPPLKRQAEIGFDWFNLSVANIQTGFGPFIAVYLTTQGWTQTAIGVALSVGTVSSMISQVPAGALVDAIRNKTRVAVLSVLAFTASALLFAINPIPLLVYVAEVLHGFSSCTLGPAIAAISLGLAGRYYMGTRLGRNARFASIGNGVGAALMGACGYYISERAVFYLTAFLTLPALIALIPVRRFGDAANAANEPAPAPSFRWGALKPVFADKRLLIFSACALVFTFANTPLLPLASVAITTSVSSGASLYIAACIVVPQVIVALISPRIGRLAGSRGRRTILFVGFLALPIRAVLLAYIHLPAQIVIVQALDGIAAAAFGISVPLITSDIAGRSGHYTLALGIIGFAMGIGGTLSTSFAGWGADHYGQPHVFLALGLFSLLAPLLVFALPETRPDDESGGEEAGQRTPAAGPP